MAQTSALTHVLERNKRLQAMAATGSLPANILARLSDTALRPYVTDLKNNVHRDGLDAEYSKDEIWAGKTAFYIPSAFKNKSKIKGKTTEKTMYLENGYSEFREVQGLKNDRVYLEVSSDLRNAVGSENTPNGHLIGITEASQVGKYLGNKNKYGVEINGDKRLYVATNQQRSDLHERISMEIDLITKEAMNGAR